MKSVLGGEITATMDGKYPRVYELSGGIVPQEHRMMIHMQQGNPDTVGINGWTFEDVLAITTQRLLAVNEDFPSPFNIEVINALTASQALLNARYRVTTATRGYAAADIRYAYYLPTGQIRTAGQAEDFDATYKTPYCAIVFGLPFMGDTLDALLDNIRKANFENISESLDPRTSSLFGALMDSRLSHYGTTDPELTTMELYRKYGLGRRSTISILAEALGDEVESLRYLMDESTPGNKARFIDNALRFLTSVKIPTDII